MEIHGKLCHVGIDITPGDTKRENDKVKALQSALEDIESIDIRMKSLCIVYEHTDMISDDTAPGMWYHQLKDPW